MVLDTTSRLGCGACFATAPRALGYLSDHGLMKVLMPPQGSSALYDSLGLSCCCLLGCFRNLNLGGQPAQLSHLSSALSAPSVISAQPSQLSHHSSASQTQPSQLSHLSSASSAQPAQLSHLSSAISAQPAQLSHLSSAISGQPSQLSHLSSATSGQPSQLAQLSYAS